eukprot:3833809-Pyramimonas_sp.AAC.1
MFPLPSLDWVIHRAYSLSPHSIGSYTRNIGIFPLPSLDWVIHEWCEWGEGKRTLGWPPRCARGHPLRSVA